MATEISRIHSNLLRRDITITRYARPSGMGYQVTWGVDKWVSFASAGEAGEFVDVLLAAIDMA